MSVHSIICTLSVIECLLALMMDELFFFSFVYYNCYVLQSFMFYGFGCLILFCLKFFVSEACFLRNTSRSFSNLSPFTFHPLCLILLLCLCSFLCLFIGWMMSCFLHFVHTLLPSAFCIFYSWGSLLLKNVCHNLSLVLLHDHFVPKSENIEYCPYYLICYEFFFQVSSLFVLDGPTLNITLAGLYCTKIHVSITPSYVFSSI